MDLVNRRFIIVSIREYIDSITEMLKKYVDINLLLVHFMLLSGSDNGWVTENKGERGAIKYFMKVIYEQFLCFDCKMSH